MNKLLQWHRAWEKAVSSSGGFALNAALNILQNLLGLKTTARKELLSPEKKSKATVLLSCHHEHLVLLI